MQGDGGESLLESLARIPPASLLKSGAFWNVRNTQNVRDSQNARKTGDSANARKLWSPAARPLGPVLRLGLFATEDPLVHKQVVLDTRAKKSDDSKFAISDDVLAVNVAHLEQSFELSRETEVSL